MTVTSSKEAYASPIFRVTEDRAVAPDGFEIRRAVVRHGGSAVMLAVDDEGRILLVRQFRLPAQDYLWELPAGRLDEGETPLDTARRELVEETGYRARQWTELVSFFASPGYVSEKMTVFVARELEAGEATPMDDERIERRWFTLDELDQWRRSGNIVDGKTLVGLLTYKELLAGE
ncbi:MAG: NUDIX hydrolase [Bryobacteraceae bacterium]|nr:NUDIX hydrolase [Bryobacteraceae bacterium]